ncbi:glycosyltransferase [Ferruginibacter sp.]|uniref:glycosyltransferase family 2 protein n=1 Tax=Ferruginibacter sp. TaxID=1940288 RepID=UPI00198A0013|nr:glycosyltransferase [Ferruginibacter sp.]MBC7628750.1 glycosyltransferase [Ferruginibacter sp.]
MAEILVSIIVATYNSSQFVIETLESTRAQTWQNIELIVSDDCSTDTTVELCSNWLAVNKDRFTKTTLITVPENTGVSANCNRSINAAQSDWIKFIAGDDILLPNCLAANMKFITENPQAKAIFSEVLLYKNDFSEENFLHIIPGTFPMNIMNPAFTAMEQYQLLLLSDRITFTPSVFLNRNALLATGGYDETNRLIEDYPMWLKLTKAGNKLYFFKTPTVGYRRHQGAASNVSEYELFKPLFLKSVAIRKKEVYPYLPWDIVGSEKHILWVSKIFQKTGMNKKKSFYAYLYKISTIYLNPFRYIVFIKKKVLRLGETNVFYSDR